MTEDLDKYSNLNYWPIFSKEGKKGTDDVGEGSAGFYTQLSNILCRFYRRKSKNGKYTGSILESAIFGKIYNFTVSQKGYGYCSMSIDQIAWEFGMSYSSTKNAINNLLKDGFIVKVEKNKLDKSKDTVAYASNINRLIELRKETKDITFNNDQTYIKRKPRDYTKKTKREIELEKKIKELEIKLKNTSSKLNDVNTSVSLNEIEYLGQIEWSDHSN